MSLQSARQVVTTAPAPPGGVAERLRGPVVLALALLAPVLFAGATVVARLAQPVGTYDPVAQTVSTLAGRGATDSWIMATALLGLGLIYLLVAAGLRRIPSSSRLVLALGAGCVLVTALARQPAQGSSAVHMTAMVLGAVAFTAWPVGLALDRTQPEGLRRGSLAAAAVMAAGLVWLCAQAWTDGTWLGVSERVLVLLQTVWPARVAVASCWPGTDRLLRPEQLTLALALLPPVLFPIGLLTAQAAQPVPDPETWSLSALASLGAAERWLMTATLGLIGALYLPIAAGLRRLPVAARGILALGGAALLVVALVPQPLGGTSAPHIAAGVTSWIAFTTWPLGVALSPSVDLRLRRASAAAFVVLAVLLLWFAGQFFTGGPLYGFSERIVFPVQCLWPIALAILALVRRRTPEPARTA